MIRGNILVVDDEPDIRSLVKEILEDEGYKVETAENASIADDLKGKFNPDLVLLDIWMPDKDGITLLKEWKETGQLSIPVVMMSGHGTVETAVEATKMGAYDFIEKPIPLAKLVLTINHAIENVSLHQENLRLRRHSQATPVPIGKSSIMQKINQQMERIAKHRTPVLITGESGVDKEQYARILHNMGGHQEAPFQSVSVSALSVKSTEEVLIMLLGQEENCSITEGLFQQAQYGTVFFKDIADMDNALQANLQNILENNCYSPIDSTKIVQLDTRVIVATSQNLAELVQQGKFRDDLFFQLNILPLHIPPLREHAEDIPELVDYFVNYFVEQESLTYRHFSVAAQNYLRNYAWPGNIRELKNLVQRLLILGTGEEIEVFEVELALGKKSDTATVKNLGLDFELPLRAAREQFEKLYLQHKLEQAGGSVSKVAKNVGMERTHLYRKLKSLGIEIKS